MTRAPAPLPHPARHGFTLVEMLVVIAIISILGGLTLAALASARRTAQEKATAATIKVIESALERYENDFGDYPPSDGDDSGLTGAENLLHCLSTDMKEGPYIKEGDINTIDSNHNDAREISDQWVHPILYWHHRDYQNRAPNKRTFRLLSMGVDGVNQNGVKGSDDIVNWNKDRPE